MSAPLSHWTHSVQMPKICHNRFLNLKTILISFVQKMPKYCANFRETSSRALLCSNHYTPRCISASCLTSLKQDSWNVSQSFSIHVTLISFEKIWASANLITMFLLQLSVLHCWLLRNLETITFSPSTEVLRCSVPLALVLENIWRRLWSFFWFFWPLLALIMNLIPALHMMP